MDGVSIELLLLFYELATVLIPAIIAWLLIARYQKHQAAPSSKSRFALYLMFSLYIFGVFYVTGAGTIYDMIRFNLEIRPAEINLLPFEEGGSLTFYVLNAVMLVPLGFLLPLIWPKTGRLPVVLLSGFSLSLLIEVSQLFNRRSTDINDLIMNTIGAIIGFLLYRFFTRKKRTKSEYDESKNQGTGLLAPGLCIGSMFVGRFFLYDGIGVALALIGLT